MPNAKGPHGKDNAKEPGAAGIPSNVTYHHIIGYTADPMDPQRAVSVYTSLGNV